MSDVDQVRLHALVQAVNSSGSAAATDVIVNRAGAFYGFLTAAPGEEIPKARGRKAKETAESDTPPKTEEKKAAESTPAAEPEKTAAASAPAASDDDFLSEDPPQTKKYELSNVRAALVDLQSAVSKEAAVKVLEGFGKAPSLGGLKPENFAAVIAEAEKQTAAAKAAKK